MNTLALDIGGANIKLAHRAGETRSRPFALWREPEALPTVLRQTAAGLQVDAVVLTMTAELCDCYATKAAGVVAVLEAAVEAFPGVGIEVWGIDGAFHPVEAVRRTPALAAAANWLALATVAARLAGAGAGRSLLIDVGSTTADLIPLHDGAVAAKAWDDTSRLREGELVYAGVGRTPVFALADRLPFRGRAVRLCAELFATTRDIYLTLGETPEAPDDLDTADNRPATVEAARDRLARTIGADRDGFTPADARALAVSADAALTARLVDAAFQVIGAGGRPSRVIVSGSGEFLAARAAGRIVARGGTVTALGSLWGPAGSEAACARALLELRHGGDA